MTVTTAMVLADVAGANDLHEGHRLWPHIQSWAAEFGLTGSDFVPQHEDLRLLSGVAPRQEHQPAEHPDHEEVDEADEHECGA